MSSTGPAEVSGGDRRRDILGPRGTWVKRLSSHEVVVGDQRRSTGDRRSWPGRTGVTSSCA